MCVVLFKLHVLNMEEIEIIPSMHVYESFAPFWKRTAFALIALPHKIG